VASPFAFAFLLAHEVATGLFQRRAIAQILRSESDENERALLAGNAPRNLEDSAMSRAHSTLPKHERKATRAERRRLGLPKGATITEVDLCDPKLQAEHRESFITAVRADVTRLDEMIGLWYRHRGECGDPNCDCGAGDLAAQAETACGSLLAIKALFGVVIIDDYPHFVRFAKDFGGDAYERLSATKGAQ
jgi:hypothetical protein